MDKFKVSTRLGIGFVVVLAISILTTAMAMWQLRSVASHTHTMMSTPMQKERMISDWHRTIYAAVVRTTAIVKSADPTLGTYFAETTAASTKLAAELVAGVEKLLETDKEKALFQTISESRKKYLSARDAAVKAKIDGNAEEAARLMDQVFLPISKVYLEQVLTLLDSQRSSMNDSAAAIDASYQTSKLVLLMLSLLGLLCSGLTVWLLSRSLLNQLGGEPSDAAIVAKKVGTGDMTIPIALQPGDTTSLMAQLQSMQSNLSHVVAQVRHGAESVATASAEIAQGNRDLSARTEQQASSLETTTASMEQLNTTVKQNADNALQANQLAQGASNVAAQGGKVVAQVVATMKDINDSSRKISDIIGVIDGIAFQTNILALNAAVEAARAGEQGRGFAVVATEVRSLAGRSAAAAKEIKNLIDASMERVEQGTALVDQAGTTMTEVVSSIRRVTDIMGEISSASSEQSNGVAQVGEAIANLDHSTQQNAALVEEMAAAAGSLNALADDLVQSVSIFKLASGTTAPAELGSRLALAHG